MWDKIGLVENMRSINEFMREIVVNFGMDMEWNE